MDEGLPALAHNEFGDDDEDAKVIGVYRSRADAEAAKDIPQ